MNFTKVKNPIDKEVALLYRGHTYVIGAKATESFPEDVAKQFVTIYQFMSLDGAEVTNTTEEETEEVEEVEVKEEEKITKPKKAKK
jgi:23S rRNA pseudoU1915 N3-methylase RlmH